MLFKDKDSKLPLFVILMEALITKLI